MIDTVLYVTVMLLMRANPLLRQVYEHQRLIALCVYLLPKAIVRYVVTVLYLLYVGKTDGDQT